MEILYVQLNDNVVTGYSQNKINENDIEVNIKDLEEDFLNCPICYIYDVATKTFKFSDEEKQKVLNKANYVPIEKTNLKELMNTKLLVFKQQNLIKQLFTEVIQLKLNQFKNTK